MTLAMTLAANEKAYVDRCRKWDDGTARRLIRIIDRLSSERNELLTALRGITGAVSERYWANRPIPHEVIAEALNAIERVK